MRNDFDREPKFKTVSFRVGVALSESSLARKLRQNAPGNPRGPLLALCWKTYTRPSKSIAKLPYRRNCIPKCIHCVSIKRNTFKNRLLTTAKKNISCARQTLYLCKNRALAQREYEFHVFAKRNIFKNRLLTTTKMNISCAR